MAVVDVPVTHDRPSLGAIRAQLGLKPVPPLTDDQRAAVALASRCRTQAWVLYEAAAAHVMYAERLLRDTDGLNDGTSAFVAREYLHQWAEHQDFGALADELVAEAADHARTP